MWKYLRVGEKKKGLSSVIFFAPMARYVGRGSRCSPPFALSAGLLMWLNGLMALGAVEDFADLRRLLPGSTSTHRPAERRFLVNGAGDRQPGRAMDVGVLR